MSPFPDLEFDVIRSARRTVAGLALAAAMALALLPPFGAIADSDAADDPKDGEPGHPDIERADQDHGEEGRFRHTIETYGNFETADAPCLTLSIRFPKDLKMQMCGDGKVVNTKNDAEIGEATVERPNQSTVVYIFKPGDIDGATTYRWHAIVRSDECPEKRCDRAPDAGWVDHVKIVTYEEWADGLLGQLNAPTCDNNHIAVVAWLANEGTEARYNPLATTYRLPGSTNFNSVGVQNYASLPQGNKATRLTIEKGSSSYGYQPIVKRLKACAIPKRTARAIRASSWCSGCSNGEYVVWLIQPVRESYKSYATRLISTL